MAVEISAIYSADIMWGEIILLNNLTISTWTVSFQDIGSGKKLRLDLYDLGTSDYPVNEPLTAKAELLEDGISIESYTDNGFNYSSLLEITRFNKLESDFNLSKVYQIRVSLVL